MLRLKGKGVNAGGRAGDQRVTLRVVLPERIDPELEAFMTEWRRKHAYDPRADAVAGSAGAGTGKEGRHA